MWSCGHHHIMFNILYVLYESASVQIVLSSCSFSVCAVFWIRFWFVGRCDLFVCQFVEEAEELEQQQLFRSSRRTCQKQHRNQEGRLSVQLKTEHLKVCFIKYESNVLHSPCCHHVTFQHQSHGLMGQFMLLLSHHKINNNH